MRDRWQRRRTVLQRGDCVCHFQPARGAMRTRRRAEPPLSLATLALACALTALSGARATVLDAEPLLKVLASGSPDAAEVLDDGLSALRSAGVAVAVGELLPSLPLYSFKDAEDAANAARVAQRAARGAAHLGAFKVAATLSAAAATWWGWGEPGSGCHPADAHSGDDDVHPGGGWCVSAACEAAAEECVDALHTLGAMMVVVDDDIAAAARLHRVARRLAPTTGPKVVTEPMEWTRTDEVDEETGLPKPRRWRPYESLLFQACVTKKLAADLDWLSDGREAGAGDLRRIAGGLAADSLRQAAGAHSSAEAAFADGDEGHLVELAELHLSMGHALSKAVAGEKVSGWSLCMRSTAAVAHYERVERVWRETATAAQLSALRQSLAIAAAHCTEDVSSKTASSESTRESADALAVRAAELVCPHWHDDPKRDAEEAARHVAAMLKHGPRLGLGAVPDGIVRLFRGLASERRALEARSELPRLGVFVPENRPIPALPSVLRNVARHVDPGTPLWLFQQDPNGPNAQQYRDAASPLEVRFIYDPSSPPTTFQGYSALMLTPELYEAFPAEHMLLVQADAMLCDDPKRSLRDYLKWDFCGAPFPAWFRWETGDHGRNGGFSLRNVAAVAETLRAHPPVPDSGGDVLPEDWHLGLASACRDGSLRDEGGALPRPLRECPAAEAALFAWETHVDFSSVPLGVHKVYAYFPWFGFVADKCRGLPNLPLLQGQKVSTRYPEALVPPAEGGPSEAPEPMTCGVELGDDGVPHPSTMPGCLMARRREQAG